MVSSDFSGDAAFFSAEASPFAWLTQSATLSMMAILVSVAPVTVSTFKLCSSTICCGTRSRAGALMRSVSSNSTISTLSMALSDMRTSTVTGPFLPGADAVYVPGTNAAVEASPSPDGCTSGAHPADTRAAWAAAMAAQATNVLRESEMLRSVGKTSAVLISFILTLLDPYFLFLYAAV